MSAAVFTPAVADDIMEMLLDAHDGLDEKKSAALNARLVLTLAAELAAPSGKQGGIETVRECISIAHQAA
jgi:hypothetical protein